VWEFCGRNADNCAALLDDYVAKTVAALKQVAARTPTAPPDISTLRLVLRPAAYALNLWKQVGGPGADSEPIMARFAGDMWLLLVVDSPESVRVFTRKDLESTSMTFEVAMEAARANMGRVLPPLARVAPKAAANGVGVIEGDFYASSRLLLHHDQWAKLASTFKGRLLVVAPEPQTLVVADGGVRNSREAMKLIAEDYAKKSDRPLSMTMFQWTPDGWKAVKR
jgi:hypothetical protein